MSAAARLTVCTAVWLLARAGWTAPLDVAPASAPHNAGAPAPVTQPADVPAGAAYIDWSARQLYAWGHGFAPTQVPLLTEAFPFSEQAAGDDARRALRALLADSQLLSDSAAQRLRAAGAAAVAGASRGTLRTLLFRLIREPDRGAPLGDAQAHETSVLDAIEQALTGSRAAQTSYLDDGSVRLQMRLPLDGGRGGLGEAWTRLRRGWADRSPLAARRADRALGVGNVPTARPPTGIVVQARGLGVAPTLWPRLVRAGAQACAHATRALYDEAHLSDEILRAFGVAPFVRSIEAALRDPRVADRAMLVRAVGRCPDVAATLLISDADADAIEAEDELLREGRVIFVID